MSREARVLKLAHALSTSPHFSTEAAYEDFVTKRKARGVQLKPIPWGKRDPDLARVVLRHMTEANPPIVISWNPVTHPRLIAWLRSSGIYH